MTPRTPENSWSLITVIGVPPRDPNDDEDNDAEPDTIASRRLSENPTKT